MNVRLLLSSLLLFTLFQLGLGHPANIPIARAKINPDGSFTLNLQFDILAFTLDEDPQVVLDPPMNALLDGTAAEFQSRLDDAKQRLLDGLKIAGRYQQEVVTEFKFPTAQQIQASAREGRSPRLPVMWSIDFQGKLPQGSRDSSFSFPEVLGTVVLTTEFPYTEPMSEPVEPGTTSLPRHIPSAEEVAKLVKGLENVNLPAPAVSEEVARTAIQKQYDAWSRAYMEHDVPTLLGMLAPDYTLKTAKGTVITRAEYDVMLKVRKKQAEATSSYKTEILRITLKDGVAAIFSRETTNNPRKNEKTGVLEPNIWEHDYIDLWIQRDGKWLLKSTITQREEQISKQTK
jgi:hypothetical protein